MIIDCKFYPRQRVHILPIENTNGRIMEIAVASGRDIQYKVIYYTEGQERQCYFWEDELEELL